MGEWPLYQSEPPEVCVKEVEFGCCSACHLYIAQHSLSQFVSNMPSDNLHAMVKLAEELLVGPTMGTQAMCR